MNDVALQYQIKCFLAGVIDGPGSSGVSISEKLRRLEEWHLASSSVQWINPNPALEMLAPLPVFLESFGPAYCEVYSEYLRVILLQSPKRGRQARQWQVEFADLGFVPLLFSYDHGRCALFLLEKW